MKLKTIVVVALLAGVGSIPMSMLTAPLMARLTAPTRHALQCEFVSTAWDTSKSPHERVEGRAPSVTSNVYLEFLPDAKILVAFMPPGSIGTDTGVVDTTVAAVEVTNIDYTISLGMVFHIDRQTGALTGHNPPPDKGENEEKFNGACHAVAPRLMKL
jgi:hypothetical protein